MSSNDMKQNEQRKNLGWCPNDEKANEQMIKPRIVCYWCQTKRMKDET